MAETRVRVGLSGWSYDHWKDGFYRGVPRRRWLAFCAERFGVMEVNATFYRFMRPDTYAKWRDETPDDFRFILKGHRGVTHNRKLKGTDELVESMRDSAAPLAGKTAALLWQLPPTLKKDLERLGAFAETLAALWPGPTHAVEFRHPSWFDAETEALMERTGLTNVISDAGRWERWDASPGPVAYARLHGRPNTYADAYGRAGLAEWVAWAADRDGGIRELYVTFDNDGDGHAPEDAALLIEMLGTGGPP